MAGFLLYTTILTDHYLSFKHKFLSQVMTILVEKIFCPDVQYLSPVSVHWKLEFENKATGSKYQTIM